MHPQGHDSTDVEYLYGRALYPAGPLSWLAPLWALVCGALASGATTWGLESMLRWMLGLLLVGPLLGIVWALGAHVAWPSPADLPPGEHIRPVRKLPFTQPGSPSSRLSRWIALTQAQWDTVRPVLARPALQLAVSTLGALVVAAQLGRQPFFVTATQLAIVYLSVLTQKRWASNLLFSVALPVFLAWLLGHSLYHSLTIATVVVGASFALALYAHNRLSESRPGLLWLSLAQALTCSALVFIKQPVVAAIVGLLATLQFLLLPLLESEQGRHTYFSAVQVHLVASMILSALALGY